MRFPQSFCKKLNRNFSGKIFENITKTSKGEYTKDKGGVLYLRDFLTTVILSFIGAILLIMFFNVLRLARVILL